MGDGDRGPGHSLKHLALAESHVEQGRRHVARQREIAAEFAGSGPYGQRALRHLAQFDEALRLHLDDLDRIRAELGRLR
jgi:hypothetical protein